MYSVLITPRRIKDFLRDGLYLLFYIPLKIHYLDYKRYIDTLFKLNGETFKTSTEMREKKIERKYDV